MRVTLEVGLLALAVTSVASPITVRLLKQHQILDEPSHRSAHNVAIPRGGGIACLIGLLIAIGTASHLELNSKLLFGTAAAAFAGLGFADDVGGISIRFRLVGQVALAAVISWWALHASSPKFGIALVACLVGGIWIVAYVNVFNFMDGMNGLAGLAAAIAGITFALIGFHQHHLTFAIGGAALAGAALGFLPWNFPNARVFLGDVGSYLLGAWTVLLMLLGWKAHLPWECLMGPVALFTADTGWTLAGRIVRGEDWTASHKQHVYQRLHQGGWSHTQTTLFLGILISVCAALGSLSLTHSLGSRVLGDGLIVLLLAAYLSSPRFLAQVKRSTS